MDIIFIGLFIIFACLWIFKIFKEEQDKSIKELRKQSEDMKENPEKYGY